MVHPCYRFTFEKEIIKELSAKAEDPEDADVIELDYGMQLPRTKLPQIKSTDVPEFIEWLETQGVSTERDPDFDPKGLTPIQKEINLDKVAGMVAKKGLDALASDKPVMISGDDYLIDGHHRWYALLDAEYPTISVVRIGLSADDLIEKMRGWDKASFKDITAENNMTELVAGVMNYLIRDSGEDKWTVT